MDCWKGRKGIFKRLVNKMAKKMNILVVEDTQVHIEEALRSLAEHNVAVARTYGEANESLEDSRYRVSYGQEGIDVVLTDLYMSFSERPMYEERNGEWEEGTTLQLRPFGFPIVMQSLAQEIPYIALATSLTHHHGPMHLSVDALRNMGYDHGKNIRKSRVLIASKYVKTIRNQEISKDYVGMLDYLINNGGWESSKYR
jgi:CheY-like chemotaxis protein